MLADVCDVVLPMLGDRPLGGLGSEAREAVLDGAARSLLARGVLARVEDTVGVVRAAAGLLGIVAASSLRVQVIVDRNGKRAWHTVHAVPYAAVDASIDDNGNHRLAPFATEDLLVHVGDLTGLLPAAADTIGENEGTGYEVSLPYGSLRLARLALTAGDEAGASHALVGAGLAGGAAALVLDVLRAATHTAAVQIIHHPTPSTSAGGEVAWVDAGALGIWLVPTVDQPFARLARPGEDEHDDVVGRGGSLGTGTRADAADAADVADPGLDARIVTLARTTGAAILADLRSVLPTSA